jgi:hypothetical protein
MVVTNVPQHMWVHPRHPDPRGGGQVLEPSGRRVAVHPDAERVAQDRPVGAVVDGVVDRPPDRWWQRHENDLAALAAHPQHAVPVFLTEVGDVRPARFEDPQPCRPRRATSAKSLMLAGSRAVVISASNCR